MAGLVGQNIERYQVVEKIGQGGMATVYRGFDTRLERDVAIKVIRTNAIPAEKHAQVLKRFEREAKALARMSHQSIVKVYDYGEYAGAPYLVMEYLPGGTLERWTGTPRPYRETARLLLPVASALAYAHKAGIIHRDIKPSNILITHKGEPLLSDFGIAKILGTGQAEKSVQLTGTGVSIGSPEYMAPEQWMGQVSPQADVYALGIVFFELVTGRRPYTAETPAAVLVQHLHEPLPRARDFVPDLPFEVEQMLFKALAKKPEDRYASMNAFARVLKSLAGASPLDEDEDTWLRSQFSRGKQAGVPGSRSAEQSAALRKRFPRWAWIAGGSAGLLVVAVVIILAVIILAATGSLSKPTLTATHTLTIQPTAVRTTALPVPTDTLPPPSATAPPEPTSTASLPPRITATTESNYTAGSTPTAAYFTAQPPLISPSPTP
jgi:serine/threonine protein kinase